MFCVIVFVSYQASFPAELSPELPAGSMFCVDVGQGFEKNSFSCDWLSSPFIFEAHASHQSLPKISASGMPIDSTLKNRHPMKNTELPKLLQRVGSPSFCGSCLALQEQCAKTETITQT